MRFGFASCELCNKSVFNEDDVFAFRWRDGTIDPVGLEGRSPWAGIRCVCKKCAATVILAAARSKTEPSPP